MARATGSTTLTREEVKQLEVDIVPGLKDRLIAELDRIETPADQRVQTLAGIAGRALQTVARWIDKDKPGLPDARSLAILCIQFGIDANSLLGLTRSRLPFPFDQIAPGLHKQLHLGRTLPVDWIGRILSQTRQQRQTCKVAYMRGDDMVPLIEDGAPYFYDDTITHVEANGIYLLNHDGRTLVRHVEIRIGEGILLRCENERYANTMVRQDAAPPPLDLKVLGRVTQAINVRKL